MARTAMVIGAVLAVVGACSQPGPEPSRPAPEPSSPAAVASPPPHEYAFSDSWGEGAGCTPKGPELTLVGTLLVFPFGKGTDGAVVKTDDGDWIVSYRAEGALLALQGKRVVARGRACDKQGQAIVGKHFDLATLAEPVPPG